MPKRKDDLDLQHQPTVPDGPRPINVICPMCSASAGVGCSTATGWGTRTHAPRWRAVGVLLPTPQDLHRDYVDQKRRRLDAIRAQPAPAWLLEVRARAAVQAAGPNASVQSDAPSQPPAST